MSEQYRIILTGKIKPQSDKPQTVKAMARLFKLSEEKAESLLGKPRVVKKGLDKESALRIAKKLSAMGLDIAIQRETQKSNTIVEAKKPPQPAQTQKSHLIDSKPQNTPPSAKTQHQHSSTQTQVEKLATDTYHDDVPFMEKEIIGGVSVLMLIVGVASAVLATGILFAVYYFVVEVSLSSRTIGKINFFSPLVMGLIIGGAVSKVGGEGIASGMLCALLAAAAIFGGKYAFIEYKIHQMGQEYLAEIKTLAKRSYESERELADKFSRMSDEEFLATMKEYDDTIDDSIMDNKELFSEFRTAMIEKLGKIKSVTFEQWYNETYKQWFNKTYSAQLKKFKDQISTWDLLKKSFGVTTLLVFLAGMGIAFKVGSSRE